MPPPKYANLSLLQERQIKIRKMYDQLFGKNTPWVDWVGNTLDSALLHEKYLKEKFPHIRFIGNVKNGCVLEDTRTKSVVNVVIKGDKVTSTPHGEQYVLFALLTPRLLLD